MSGDLIIYPFHAERAPYGHVAAVLTVNTALGYLDLGEQNYDNGLWKVFNKYARRMALLTCDCQPTLTELVYDTSFKTMTPAQIQVLCAEQKLKVVVFKRVIQ